MLVPTASKFPSGENARAVASVWVTRSVAASTASSSAAVSFNETMVFPVSESRIRTAGFQLSALCGPLCSCHGRSSGCRSQWRSVCRPANMQFSRCGLS